MEYGKRKGHRIVVVFDGWKGGSGPEQSSVRGGVKVVYSGLGERADAVIKRIVSAEGSEWVVVSSDREVAACAWAAGSVPLRSEQFLPLLRERRERAFSGAEAVTFGKDDAEEREPPARGSARQLSRREKAVKRALGKLS